MTSMLSNFITGQNDIHKNLKPSLVYMKSPACVPSSPSSFLELWKKPWNSFAHALLANPSWYRNFPDWRKVYILANIMSYYKFNGVVRMLRFTPSRNGAYWFPENSLWNETLAAIYRDLLKNDPNYIKSLLNDTAFKTNPHQQHLDQLTYIPDILDIGLNTILKCRTKL